MPLPPLELGVTTDLRKLTAISRRLAAIPMVVRRAAKFALQDVLGEALRYMVRTYLSGQRTTRTTLAKRSGRLIRSFRWAVKTTPSSAEGRLYQLRNTRASVYGPVHEFGATIRPRRARALTIPLNAEARARPARQIRGLFLIRSKKGNLLLVRKTADGVEPFFLLRDEVRIPRRPYVAPTARKFIPIARQRTRAAVAEAIALRRAGLLF